MQHAKSYPIFRKPILKFGRPSPTLLHKIHDPSGVKFLTRLRLGLNHLSKHRLNHNFENWINLLCSCSLDVESTKYFFMRCYHYTNIFKILLNTVKPIVNNSILNIPNDNFFIFGNCRFSLQMNSSIIKASDQYISKAQKDFLI